MDDILTDFSTPALIEAIEANQLAFMADLGRSPQVALQDDPEITWFVTGVPSPGFNRVLRAQFEADNLDAKIETTLDLFRSRALPMLWHTGPSTRPADLGKRLIAHGLMCTADEPGMAADLLLLGDDPPLPPGLRIRHVRDLETLEAWSRTVAQAFGSSDSVGDAKFWIEASLGPAQHPARHLYVGFLKGEPVATSLLFLGAGVAGLYGVATIPEVRRQGIGEAMTRVPLLEARALGYQIATLHASPMGLGTYRRLGFREYCRLAHYTWRKGKRINGGPNLVSLAGGGRHRAEGKRRGTGD
jgi:ribosomal protein S18 acetylase RimI-like enzyme